MVRKLLLIGFLMIGVGWGVVQIGNRGFRPSPVLAQSGDIEAQKREIDELIKKLGEIQSQKQSLSQTLQYITTRVLLTEKEVAKTQTEIAQLKQQIGVLENKIGVLDINLGKLSGVMVNRLKETYMNSSQNPMLMLLTANGLNDFFKRYKYLQVSGQHDREVIFALEEARANYDQQKQVKETKQLEMEALQAKLVTQQNQLTKQQKEKQAALTITRNDERRYQEQLAKALAELSAIQSIIAGKGKEVEVGQIQEGAVIATVITGASACSSGSHLHLEVTQNSIHANPANFLSAKDLIWDNAPDGPFGFSGSWRWPVEDKVRITQGYGMTFYAGTLRYYGGQPHTGLDMISDSGNMTVRAVKPGILYRGAIACGRGNLQYVHVDQGDGLSTYYLHVNY